MILFISFNLQKCKKNTYLSSFIPDFNAENVRTSGRYPTS